MIKETDFESILIHEPGFIEDGLQLVTKQQYLDLTHRVDLIFKDKNGHHLIVELKLGLLSPNAIMQIKSYGQIYSKVNPNEKIRLMLVANRINADYITLLKNNGIEYKEIPVLELENYMNDGKKIDEGRTIKTEKAITNFNRILNKLESPYRECFLLLHNKLLENPDVDYSPTQAGYCVYSYNGKKFCNIEARGTCRVEIFLYNGRFDYRDAFTPFYKISDRAKQIRPIGNLTSYWYEIETVSSIEDLKQGNLLCKLTDRMEQVYKEKFI